MSVFQFKKFNISQDRCAMKVGTDGVLLGAWVDTTSAASALDIGAGTGILSLMMAQRSAGLHIQAIEIDPEAAQQCAENFEASPWNDRLGIECISFLEFIEKTSVKWDLIVCNPPYFHSGVLSDSVSRNRARHASSLSAQDIFAIPFIKRSEQCRLALIIPSVNEAHYSEIALINGWYLKRKTMVVTTIGKSPARVLLELDSSPVKDVATDCLTIEMGARNVWSDEYKMLTRDFYTIL